MGNITTWILGAAVLGFVSSGLYTWIITGKFNFKRFIVVGMIYTAIILGLLGSLYLIK